jgi:hypothetical protein
MYLRFPVVVCSEKFLVRERDEVLGEVKRNLIYGEAIALHLRF